MSARPAPPARPSFITLRIIGTLAGAAGGGEVTRPTLVPAGLAKSKPGKDAARLNSAAIQAGEDTAGSSFAADPTVPGAGEGLRPRP